MAPKLRTKMINKFKKIKKNAKKNYKNIGKN